MCLKNPLTTKTLPEKIEPKSFQEIRCGQLVDELSALHPRAQLFMSDKVYLKCCLEDIKAFLAQDKTNKQKYKVEAYDCDDFAYRLMGQFSIPKWSDLAFGICWTDLHAMNCFIDSEGRFKFVEPQKDTIQDELEPWQGTFVRLIMM